MNNGEKLPPAAYLNQNWFSQTTRYVVRPQNETHVVVAKFSNGQIYVCVEDLKGSKWEIRRNGRSQGFSNPAMAEAFAAEVHREESRVARLRASVPDKKE